MPRRPVVRFPMHSGAGEGWRRLLVVALLVATLGSAGCRRAWKWPTFARKHAPEQAEELAQQARRAADRGDTASAEYLLTAAVATNPHDCETRLELSEMLLEHGSLPAATDHLRRVVRDNPGDARGYLRLSQALFLQQDLAGAETELNNALERDPANPQSWLLLARIESLRHHDKEALTACYKALSAEPDLAPAQLLTAQLQLAQGQPEQAMPLLQRLLEQNDSYPVRRADAEWLLGLCYAREGRWDDAASTLRHAIDERSESAANWYQLAYASYRAGDATGSMAAVQHSLAISPKHSAALSLRRLLENDAAKRGHIAHTAEIRPAP